MPESAKTNIPTAQAVLAQQKADHEKGNGSTAVALAGGVSAYLAEHGVGLGGTPIKFSKEGKFVRTSDDEPLPEDARYVCVYDQTQAGMIRFFGKGEQPERHMGPIFQGFMPPKREELGDLDQSQWDVGLSGQPVDPWQHQMLLPLQDIETGELMIFNTSSVTGRRAVGALLTLCERMRVREPDQYPVVKLRIGGFNHRDERVGWVKTPAFDVVGRTPKGETATATAAIANDLDDAIPF
jgi:hypothetical protein